LFGKSPRAGITFKLVRAIPTDAVLLVVAGLAKDLKILDVIIATLKDGPPVIDEPGIIKNILFNTLHRKDNSGATSIAVRQ
jgi:hypothetical protein